jgi:hypothetical protein
MQNAIARHNDTSDTPNVRPLRMEDLCVMSGNALTTVEIAPENTQGDTSLESPPEGMAYQWMSSTLARYSERRGTPAYKPEQIAWYTARPEDLEALCALFEAKRKGAINYDVGSNRAPGKLQEKEPHEAGSFSLSKFTDDRAASHPKPEAAGDASTAKSENLKMTIL